MENFDNRVLAMLNFRHRLTEYLLNIGGHIGYSVRPSERCKGYGKLQLELALDKCRERGVRYFCALSKTEVNPFYSESNMAMRALPPIRER
ncbi:MAG: GNAT family N-acetyltransferase [Oscillospiraceae bacterium]|nr:GNAT family N-acetyltransferase [Oscillospiraceae bacterium]